MTRCMLYRRGHIGDKGRGRQGECIRIYVYAAHAADIL